MAYCSWLYTLWAYSQGKFALTVSQREFIFYLLIHVLFQDYIDKLTDYFPAELILPLRSSFNEKFAALGSLGQI